MLEESARFGEVFALLIAAVGAGIIGYSILAKRSIFIMAIGVLLTASALITPMLVRGQPITVMVIQHNNGEINILRRDSFYGGTYVAKNGNKIVIDRKQAWGRTATFLINDSTHLITVTGYQYSAFEFAGGSADLLSYLLPQDYRAFPRRISFTGDAIIGPPKKINSLSTSNAIIFLAYSRKPYDPSLQGDEKTLESKLAVPQLMERVSFKQTK